MKKNTFIWISLGVLCMSAAVLIALVTSPFFTYAGLVNSGTAGNPSGALSDSGCPSCNAGGLTGTDTGVGVGSPISSTLPSSYGQSSYYRQGSYSTGGGGGYAQGSYSSGGYSQGSYSSYGQGSYSMASEANSYSQSSYFTCPSGYKVFQGRSCCPSQYYAVIDTNGSKKGGRVEQCNIPDGESSNGTSGASPSGAPVVSVEIENMWIKAEPSIVRFDGSSTISWDGGNAEACTVTGYALNETTLQGNKQVTDFMGESVYTLTCTLGSKTKSIDTTVRVLPRSQET